MPDVEWGDCLSKIQPLLVRIEIPDSYGSGFMVEKYQKEKRELLLIATAYHVVAHAVEWLEPIRITHVPTSSVFAFAPDQRVVYHDIGRDLALIEVDAKHFPFPAYHPLFTPAGSYVVPGHLIGWCGYPNIAPSTSCFFTGYISALYNDGGDYYVDGNAVHGVSGGPAFAALEGDTKVIGLVTNHFANVQPGHTLPGLSVVRNINPIADSVRALRTPLLEGLKQPYPDKQAVDVSNDAQPAGPTTDAQAATRARRQ